MSDSKFGPGARRTSLAILTGALLVFSFPPLGHWLVGWVALVPLMLAINDAGPFAALRLGFLAGYAAYAFLLHWFYHLFGWRTPALWALPAAFVGLWAWLWVWLGQGRSGWYRLMLAPLIWVALEFFRSEGYYLRFSWFGLGYSQIFPSPYLQMADLLGVYGISFLIVLFSSAVQLTVSRKLQGREAEACWAVVLLLMAVSATRGIVFSRNSPDLPNTDESFVVGIVQDETSSIPEKATASIGLTRAKPKLVVWPEYSTSTYALEEPATMATILGTAVGLECYLVVGTMTHSGPVVYNSAVVFGPAGSQIGQYNKHVPVQMLEDVRPGGEFNVIPTSVAKLGIAICYDASFPMIPRALVKSGAELLVVPAYDAFEWGMVEKAQHVSVVSMRAVETRRFLVRAASSGISVIFDPYGQAVAQALAPEPTVIWGTVQPRSDLTFFVKYGWLLPYWCGLVGAIVVLAKIVERMAEPRHPPELPPETAC